MSPPPAGPRVSFALILAAILLVCFVLPRWFYAARLAMIELRYGALLFLVVGGFLWLLFYHREKP